MISTQVPKVTHCSLVFYVFRCHLLLWNVISVDGSADDGSDKNFDSFRFASEKNGLVFPPSFVLDGFRWYAYDIVLFRNRTFLHRFRPYQLNFLYVVFSYPFFRIRKVEKLIRNSDLSLSRIKHGNWRRYHTSKSWHTQHERKVAHQSLQEVPHSNDHKSWDQCRK